MPVFPLKRLKRLQRHEVKAKKQAQARKQALKNLECEAKQQEEVLATYHSLLAAIDPELAERVGWTEDGRLVERRAPFSKELGGDGRGGSPVRLLHWDKEEGGVEEGA
jgi:hypothetical protein